MLGAIIWALLVLAGNATIAAHTVAYSTFALAFAHAIFVTNTLGAVKGTIALVALAHSGLGVTFTLFVAVVLACLPIAAFTYKAFVALAGECVFVT